MTATVRLQRFLASAGVSARRKAEELITAGRVSVNGAIVRTLGTKVDPDHDSVTVDGEAVAALDTFYVLFNKPKGCITAVSDDRGRPTVMDYLPNLPVPVKPVGRLDFYSEGVLLLTNDGELAARLLAPASHVPKTYHVKVHGQLTKEEVTHLRDGVRLDDGSVTLPAEIAVLPGESKHTWLGITIHEGKHRQIHRMLDAIGYQIDKLQRVAFANLSFHDLRIGDARELTQLELNELRDMVGLDHSAVARGTWHKQREMTDIPRRARMKARAEAEELAAGNPGAGPSEGAPGDEDDEVYDDARESEAWSSTPPARSFGTQQSPRHGRAAGKPARGGRSDPARRSAKPSGEPPRRAYQPRDRAGESSSRADAGGPRGDAANRGEGSAGRPASRGTDAGRAPRRGASFGSEPGAFGRPAGRGPRSAERPRSDSSSNGPRGTPSYGRGDTGNRGGGSYPRGASSGGGPRGASSGGGPRGASSGSGPRGAASGSGPRGAASGSGPRNTSSGRDPVSRGGGSYDRGPRSASPSRGPSSGRGDRANRAGGSYGRGPRSEPSRGASSSGGSSFERSATTSDRPDPSRSAFKPGETGARVRPDAHPGTERFDPNPPRSVAPREPRGGAKPGKRADKPRWRDSGGPPVRDGAPRGQGRSFGKRGKPSRGR